VHPDDLQSLEDLAKFPFTVKQNLRDNYPFGMFAVPKAQVNASMRHQAPPASRQ
jgi:phenylacetate-CoA ligase